jgi:hypothetical protein
MTKSEGLFAAVNKFLRDFSLVKNRDETSAAFYLFSARFSLRLAGISFVTRRAVSVHPSR